MGGIAYEGVPLTAWPGARQPCHQRLPPLFILNCAICGELSLHMKAVFFKHSYSTQRQQDPGTRYVYSKRECVRSTVCMRCRRTAEHGRRHHPTHSINAVASSCWRGVGRQESRPCIMHDGSARSTMSHRCMCWIQLAMPRPHTSTPQFHGQLHGTIPWHRCQPAHGESACQTAMHGL